MTRNPILVALLVLGLSSASSTLAVSLRYQGELLDQGLPANGRYDLQLTPFVDAVSPRRASEPVVYENVLIEDGLFVLEPDFGKQLVGNDSAWVELAVRDADSDGAFATLPDRQKASLAPTAGQCWSTSGDSGINPTLNYLGTNDGAALVLRSSAGVGINTSTPRDTLTVSGPDDYDDGPTLHFAGEVADQVESGRIRFVETATSNTARGGYIRFDGQSNRLALGGHAATSNLAADDTDHLVILRDAPSRVGIGMVPSESLDVSGDIRTSGRIKFSERSVHEITLPGGGFSETKDNNCLANTNGIRKNDNFGAGTCVAYHSVQITDNANIVGLQIIASNTDTQTCRAKLFYGPGLSPPTFELVSVNAATNAASPSSRTTTIPAEDLLTGSAVLVRVEVASTECTIAKVRVRYTLPEGFIP